jgi:predicted dehydrogenase
VSNARLIMFGIIIENLPQPLRIAFLGCGFITAVHSRHLRALGRGVVCSYASRDKKRSDDYCARFAGVRSYGDYGAAIDDPSVDAIVVAVPPSLHSELTLRALAAGKHVIVEKPAFPRTEDYLSVIEARNRAGRVVLIGENDHYKPLAVCLRRLLADGTVGELIFANFTTIARKLKPANDWRNDVTLAAGDAFFEEGIHWLHLAGSLGPRITSIHGYRPQVSPEKGDTRVKSMMVAFRYDSGAVGSLYYSREIPSLFRGLRLSTLSGRGGIISFESNGAFVLARGKGLPKLIFPGFRDIRGYQAMYRDFARAISEGRAPEMSLERAMDDHRLMETAYDTLHA